MSIEVPSIKTDINKILKKEDRLLEASYLLVSENLP